LIFKDTIFLAQTDTTVGFLSHSKDRLCAIKNRNKNKSFLQICSTLYNVKNIARIPNKYKNMLRRSKNSTFIHQNKKATRLSFDCRHNRFLDKYAQNNPLFSTSANMSNFAFDKDFAICHSDVIVYQKQDFMELQASSLYKINNQNIKKISRKI